MKQRGKKERLGMERISRDGKKARIIQYNSCEDFVIEFEDGTKRKMSHFKDFESGKFNYQYMFHKPRTEDRNGTTARMNNGLQATVICYRNSHDMDVRFEDGAEAYNVSWRDFLAGNVAHPNVKGTRISINELVLAFYLEPFGFIKVGQRSKLSKELMLGGKEIDLYHPGLKIAVEYDGEYAHREIQKDIEKNQLFKELGIVVYRFREPRCPLLEGNCYILEGAKSLSGSLEKNLKKFVQSVLKADASKIDFANDKKAIMKFVRERKRCSLHLFEERMMSNGMKGTIVEMLSCNDITVQFEDGKKVFHKCYSSFCKGNIAHPDETSEEKRKQRLYQKRIMNNGHEATVVEYEAWNRLVIEFDNGEKVYNKTWWDFENGSIGLPSSYIKNCIGERILQKRGMYATLVSGVDANHIDVKFDDGTIVKNRKYNDFKKGIIGNPNLLPARKRKDQERLGEVKMMRDGSVGKIVKYRNAGDIDIDFGDGKIVMHKKYANFAAGSVKGR